MRPTLTNRIKLWWHCLIHFHRASIYKVTWEVYKIDCMNCQYGRSN
jgi:hypothetical protein